MQRFIVYNVFAMTWQHPTFHAKSAQMEFQAVHLNLYSQLCIIHPKQCKAMGYFELHAANSEAPMTSQKEQQGKSALLAFTICCLCATDGMQPLQKDFKSQILSESVGIPGPRG